MKVTKGCLRSVTRNRKFFANLASAVLAVVLAITPVASGQSLDNKGTDFLLTFLPNVPGGNQQVQVQLNADATTNVTMVYPANSPTFTTTVTVNPGAITTVTLPVDASNGWSPGSVDDNVVRCSAPSDFGVYMINRRSASSDAALGLPIDTFNTEYIATTYISSNIGSSDRSYFAVVAAFNLTNVTITPTANLVGGYSLNSPFSIVLDAGEAFLAESTTSGAAGDLTGSIIESDRPIGMTNGNFCTNVPPTTSACDAIFEVAQPVQTWGDRVFVANLPQRPDGTVYRIIASEDNTDVFRDNTTLIGTINRGVFIEYGPNPDDFEVNSNKPIFITQFMTGDSSPNAVDGDPAMGNMIPAEQYLDEYTFATVGGGQFATQYLTVIAEDSDIGTLLLDGTAIPAASFTTIGATGFSVARVPLASGTHSTSSTNPHGITVEGYAFADSFIFPGGALFQFINPSGDTNPPICEIVSVNQTSATGKGTDNRPSEDVNNNGILDPGEDLNGNGLIDEDTGIFFVQLEAGATNLALVVDPFIPGDPMATYTVNLVDLATPGNGTVIITDGAGNTCSSAFELGQDTGTDPCTAKSSKSSKSSKGSKSSKAPKSSNAPSSKGCKSAKMDNVFKKAEESS